MAFFDDHFAAGLHRLILMMEQTSENSPQFWEEKRDSPAGRVKVVEKWKYGWW